MLGRKIIFAWLIFCVIAAVLVVGCSSPKNATSNAASNAPLPPLASMLHDFPSLQQTNIQADTAIVPSSPRKRIPTLREQMQIFENKQASTDKKIDSVAQELSAVKNEVEVLKNSFSGTFQPKATAKPGISSKSRDEDAEILSDEDTPKSNTKPVIKPKSVKPKAVLPKKTIARKEEVNNEDEIKPDEKPKKTSELPKTDTAKNPAKPGALYHSAMSLISKKQYEEAINLLNETLKTEKNSETLSNTYYWLGESYFGTSKFDQAISNFQKVLTYKNSTKLDDSQLMIAEAYQRLGRNDEAKKAFQKLVDYYPTSEFVPRAKKMLQKL
ncbi:MAG: tetratricopeptide repeat protein [Ignavibacteriae bacterium]|nr:tetratricopeptide repeat protein [Ignavibacteriota bacterium]